MLVDKTSPDSQKPQNGLNRLSLLSRHLQSNKLSNLIDKKDSSGSEALKLERSKATFDVSIMTNFLYGGENLTKRRRFILSATLAPPTIIANGLSGSASVLPRN